MDTYLANAQAARAQSANAINAQKSTSKTGDTDFSDLLNTRGSDDTAQSSAQRDARPSKTESRPAQPRSTSDKPVQHSQSKSSQSRSSHKSDHADTTKSAQAKTAKTKDIAAQDNDSQESQETSDTDAAASDAKTAQAQVQTQAEAADPADSVNAIVSASLAAASDADAPANDSADSSSSLSTSLDKLLAEIAVKLEGKDTGGLSSADAKTLADAAQSGKPVTLALLSPACKQKLLAALQTMMNGLPAANRPTIETLENGVLKTLDSTKLAADDATADTTDAGTSALIVSGMTPQQLTDLMKKLKDGDDKDATSEAGALMAGMVQLIPVDVKKEAVFQPRASILPVQPPVNPAGQLAQAAANAGGTGKTASNDDDADHDSASLVPQLTSMDSLKGQGKTDSKASEGGFDHILRMFESARQPTSHATALSKAADRTADLTAVNSVLPPDSQADAGALTATLSADGSIVDAGSLAGMQAAATPAGNFVLTGAGQMTSLITASPQAIYAHPATQQVAVTLTKQAGEGESTAMIMKLDPPDLGKVSVKMEFRDDKTIKAVISADKPETFMMLQRDAHVLERQLADAGVNVGSGGLSFELSQGGQSFQQNNQGRGGNAGSQGAFSSDSDTVIETTMDWSVDQRTGTLHYDVLA